MKVGGVTAKIEPGVIVTCSDPFIKRMYGKYGLVVKVFHRALDPFDFDGIAVVLSENGDLLHLHFYSIEIFRDKVCAS